MMSSIMALARMMGRRTSSAPCSAGRICASVLPLRRSSNTMVTIIARTRALSSSTPQSSPPLMDLLLQIEKGQVSARQAHQKLQTEPAEDDNNEATSNSTVLESFANLDHGRSRRTGFPEAIFAAGKTPEQIAAILDNMAHHVNSSIPAVRQTVEETTASLLSHNNNNAGSAILATRVDQDLFDKVSAIPLKNGAITYHSVARIISMRASGLGSEVERGTECQKQHESLGKRKKKRIIVACAGTTDVPVAEEAAVTLEATTAGAGIIEVERIYDVGVAGLHRIIRALPKLLHEDVGCIIVCAGMDGALPSVVAGLVSVPVIAVPTSVGYGAAFGGLSAMGTMLNSCAPGVGVVNIDNGFGAAALAFKCINNNNDTHS